MERDHSGALGGRCPPYLRQERAMKYTEKQMNKFREYVSLASDYVRDSGDDELFEKLDEVLDFIVYVLDTSYPDNKE